MFDRRKFRFNRIMYLFGCAVRLDQRFGSVHQYFYLYIDFGTEKPWFTVALSLFAVFASIYIVIKGVKNEK